MATLNAQSSILRLIVILYEIIYNMATCNFAQSTLMFNQQIYLLNHSHHDDLAS